MTDSYTITVPYTVPRERVEHLLSGGLPWAFSYWLTDLDYDDEWDGRLLSSEVLARDVPFKFSPECELPEPRKHNIAEALELLATECPGHWYDFINENEDAITGDVFVQLLCFGEVVYG